MTKPLPDPISPPMRHTALAATLLILAAPALAQDDPFPDAGPGIPFLEEWADRTDEMMRELMEEFGPGMEGLMADMLPRLKELSDRLGGIIHYEMPEVLPNGDIIIRRKPDAPPLPPDMDADNDPIDL